MVQQVDSMGALFEVANNFIVNEGSNTVIARVVKAGRALQDPADKTGIYRISTPVPPMPPMLPAGFTFNSFLLVDEQPLLFHTGLKGMFPLVRAAVEKVIPAESLKYIAYSHSEADECGSLNDWLEAAPGATAICSQTETVIWAGDQTTRPPRGLADGEEVSLGIMTVTFVLTPHTPHGWGCGYLFETSTSTLLCGDLFTQHGGPELPAITDATPLEEIPIKMFEDPEYWAWTPRSMDYMKKLANLKPTTLCCMHGTTFKGEACGQMLLDLGLAKARQEGIVAA